MNRSLLSLLISCLLAAASARAQEAEPNDDFSDATAIVCGQTLTAAMGGPTDVDFFRVDVPANSLLQAIVGQGTCSGGDRDGGACRLVGECPGGICQLQGTCLGGSQDGIECGDASDCLAGICQTPPDLDLMGFSADQVERFAVGSTLSSEDPIVTTPALNAADTSFFLKVFPLGGVASPTDYALSVDCAPPEPLSCPTFTPRSDTMFNEFEGSIDLYRLTKSPTNEDTPIEKPRRVIIDVDGDPNGFDPLVRFYDRDWKLIKEVFNTLGSNDDPNTFFGFDRVDTYMATPVFEPAVPYYAAVTCAEDFKFIGCFLDRNRPLDSQYDVTRKCPVLNAGGNEVPQITCSPDPGAPTVIADQLSKLLNFDHVEVDFRQFPVTNGDRVLVRASENSEIIAVPGLLATTGTLLDGQPVMRGPAFGTLAIDEVTCPVDSEACDEFFMPDRQISFCVPEDGTAILAVSNFLDQDFNGLDDANGQKDLIINWPRLVGDPNQIVIGPYEILLSCDRPDVDEDGTTDCLDPQVCGNAKPEPGEECDDGNTEGGDGCEADCTLPAGDTDGDGVPDNVSGSPCPSGQSQNCDDNCPFEPNNGDSPQITSVDIFDALVIAQGTLTPPLVVIPHPRACDADGSGSCDIFDALKVAQATLTPPLTTIVQGCDAATVPRKR
jgi:cysteine-rich repeat protein